MASQAGALDRTRALIDGLRAIDASAWRDLDAVLDALGGELRVLPDADHVGFMFGHWTRPYAERPGDAELVRLLALHAGLVVRVAVSLENARRAQAEAERAHDRAAFLSTASATLASSLDYEATLARVARLL